MPPTTTAAIIVTTPISLVTMRRLASTDIPREPFG
jgi:hypothetical protein